jgi:hypothetical protein
MSGRQVLLTESPERAGLAHALDETLAPEARELSAYLAWAFGASTQAVIHYGSRAQGRRTRRESAFDFFVIVSDYADAYRSVAATVGMHRAPWVASGLARILPPNVVSLRRRLVDGDQIAKVAVLSARDFRRETSVRARDHFTQGRLMQHVVIGWVRDVASRQLAVDGITNARRSTYAWGRPFLPAQFDVEEYCRTLLARSLQGEIRPEGADHAHDLVAAQRGTLLVTYQELLDELTAAGELGHRGERYELITPAGGFERARINAYFARSKARNTIRLFKHVALYDGWLDYIIEKVARSSGHRIELTERERRWPLVFGWPKFIRYLRTRPQRRD